MIYALFSDIHGKLNKLKRLFRLVTENSADKCICLGDVLDEFPEPALYEEILLKKMNALWIKGNTDKAVISKYLYSFMSGSPDGDALQNFNRLPEQPQIVDSSFVICHSSLVSNGKYIRRISHTESEFKWMQRNNIKIMFHGHTHVPQIFSLNPESGRTEQIRAGNLYNKTFQLDEKKYYIMNPGSVGVPRGGTLSSFLIFDKDKLQVKYVRI
jgi:predicted phosphodiesterase